MRMGYGYTHKMGEEQHKGIVNHHTLEFACTRENKVYLGIQNQFAQSTFPKLTRFK